MYILLLLLSVSSSRAQDNGTIVCDGVVFNNKYYDRQILFDDLGQAYNLVMHEISDQLFFSRAVRNESYSYRSFVSCHVKSKICNEVDGTIGGNTVFYHRENNDLYLGGYNGIYQYDFKTKSGKLVAETGKPIWGLFISDTKFYYISYPGKNLFVYANGTFEKVKEVVDAQVENFFVTKNYIVYFSNTTALYRVERPYIPFNPPILLNNKIIVRQIVDDYKGNVYFCASDGVYMDDLATGLKKVADIDGAYGMTIVDLTSSKGHLNIIYSDKDAIYKLGPSKNSEYCFNSPQAKNKTFAFSIKLKVKKPHKIIV